MTAMSKQQIPIVPLQLANTTGRHDGHAICGQCLPASLASLVNGEQVAHNIRLRVTHCLLFYIIQTHTFRPSIWSLVQKLHPASTLVL